MVHKVSTKSTLVGTFKNHRQSDWQPKSLLLKRETKERCTIS